MSKNVGGISGSIEIDISKATKSINRLEKQLKDLERLTDVVSNARQSGNDPYKSIASSAYQLNKQVKKTKEEMGALKAVMDASKDDKWVEELTAQYTLLEEKLNTLTESRRIFNRANKELKATGNIDSYYDKLAEKITVAKTELTGLQQSVESVDKAASKKAKSNIAEDIKEDAKAAVSEADKLTATINSIKAEIKGLDAVYSFGAEEALNKVAKEAFEADLKVAKLQKTIGMLQNQMAKNVQSGNTSKADEISTKIQEAEQELAARKKVAEQYKIQKGMIEDCSDVSKDAIADEIVGMAKLLDAKQQELYALQGIKNDTVEAAKEEMKINEAKVAQAQEAAKAQEELSARKQQDIQKELEATKEVITASKEASKAAATVSDSNSEKTLENAKQQLDFKSQEIEATKTQSQIQDDFIDKELGLLSTEEKRARVLKNLNGLHEEYKKASEEFGFSMGPAEEEEDLQKIVSKTIEASQAAESYADTLKTLPNVAESISTSFEGTTSQFKKLMAEFRRMQDANASTATMTNKKGVDVDLEQGTIGSQRQITSVKELKKQFGLLQAQIESVQRIAKAGVEPVKAEALNEMQVAKARLDNIKQAMQEIRNVMKATWTPNKDNQRMPQTAEYEAAEKAYAETFKQFQLLKEMYEYKKEVWGTAVGYDGYESDEMQSVLNSLREQAAVKQQLIAQESAQKSAIQKNSIFMSGFRASINRCLSPLKQMKKNFVDSSKDLKTMGGLANNLKGHFNGLVSRVRNMKNEANQTSRNFKEISRIVSGIVISQGFYRSLNAVQSLIGNIKDAQMLTEDLTTAFGTMYQDMDKGAALVKELQNFAALTPYTFEQVSQNARLLTAYGFQARELLPVMQQLSDASAAMGDSDQFERVVRALGQIRTKGRLMQEEVRQLTEAGIAASDILQEKLNLTAKDMQNLGKKAIPAEQAIAALLEGIQDRYAGASANLSKNTKGLMNTISDSFMIIGREATSNLWEAAKEKLYNIGYTFQATAREMMKTGLGGWLEKTFSEDTVRVIRNLAANTTMFFKSIGTLFAALGPLFKETLYLIANIANAVLPVLNSMVTMISALVYHVSQAHPWVKKLVVAFMGLLIVGGITALVKGFVKMLGKLTIVKTIGALLSFLKSSLISVAKAFITGSFATRAWIIALVAGFAIVAALIGKTGVLQKGINTLSEKLNGLMNNNVSNYLVPKKEETKTWDDYANKVGSVADAYDDVGDAAKKNAKKAKDSLASFDEVFKLAEETKDEAGDFDTTSFDDINTALGKIDPIDWKDVFNEEGLQFEMPSIITTISDFIGNINWGKVLAGAGLGAIAGGMLGLIFGPQGALAGAGIGAIAGALVGQFWDSLTQEFKDSVKGFSIGAIVGGILGTALNPGAGTAIGAAIGGSAGAIVGYFHKMIDENWSTFGPDLQFMTNTAVAGMFFGGIVSGPMGAVVGGLAGAIIGLFKNQIEEFMVTNEPAFQTIVSTGVAGAFFGGVVGGPIGAVVGGLAGGIVGWFLDKFSEKFGLERERMRDVVVTGVSFAFLGGIVAGPVGAVVGGLAGGIVGYFIDPLAKGIANGLMWVQEKIQKFIDWFGEKTKWIKDKFGELKDWVGGKVDAAIDFIVPDFLQKGRAAAVQYSVDTPSSPTLMSTYSLDTSNARAALASLASVTAGVPSTSEMVVRAQQADNLRQRQNSNNINVDTTGLVTEVLSTVIANLPTPVYAGNVIADKRTLSDFADKITVIQRNKGGNRIG